MVIFDIDVPLWYHIIYICNGWLVKEHYNSKFTILQK